MNKNKSFLDYKTFDEWNKITLEFLKNNLSSAKPDSLEEVFKKHPIEEISREEYDNLSEERKLFLVLYGYHNFISSKRESIDSFEDLLQQFEKFRTKDELLKIFGIFLTHLTHKAFIALLEEKEETNDNDALILLNQQLPTNAKKIRVMLPLVPIKSPFTIYICSVVMDLLIKLSKHPDIEYEINIGWNEISYEKIQENMKKHLDFDEQKPLPFESLKPFIEKNFLTFMHNLIINSRWGIPDEESAKIEVLRKNFKEISSYNLPKSINTPVARAERVLEEICIIMLQDVSDYIRIESPNLIEYYSEIISDECDKLKDNEYIIFITPLPAGLLMDFFLRYIQNTGQPGIAEEYARICQRVHYLCYLPFPGSEDIRHELPFYLTEYSYLLYRQKISADEERVETGKISLKRKYVRRLLISAMKRLNLESDRGTSIDRKNYDDIISMVTDIFRREENRQKEYIRYV